MTESQLPEESIFLRALEIESAVERAAFVELACSNDTPLRAGVEALLRANQKSGDLLDFSLRPAICGSAPTTDRNARELPGTFIGRYKLLEQVGEGGMGVVYVAEQTEPVRRRVALKIIKPGMDTKQVIARFEAERQALAMMDHPNIARVLDGGTTEAGRPYFVMELVRGMPITEYCDKAKLSPRQRLELFIDVCQAVQHAHQKGIIHRDLKPSNVMVTMQDGLPVVKVIDFGVAKAVGQQLTERTVYTALTQLVGTPLYMSPEQAELTSHDVDTRSDVYSLGVLLYELLTGQTPFDKETLANAGLDEMRRIIREDEPLRPSRRFSTLSAQAISTISQHRSLGERRLSKVLCGELDWIVMKALEKDRSRRYESASALAADIQRYLSDEPVLACPPTAMYRFQKFSRKHKPALATAAVIAASLILGTTVSAWQAVRATTAEAQANVNEQKATTQRDEAQRQRDEVKALADKLAAKEQQLLGILRTLYAANMKLAQNAWDEAAAPRVLDLLEQYRPKPGEADLRGFEWHYLNRLCHSDLFTLKGHTGDEAGNRSVAFSPNGKHLAYGSGTWDDTKNGYITGEVKVCDAQTGQELLTFKGHTGDVRSVAFSSDGQRVASGCGTWDAAKKRYIAGEVKVWDAQTGQELLSIKGHAGTVSSVAFSPDGKRLASTDIGDVKVWDAHSGQELLKIQGAGWKVSFSPDGKRLAISNNRDVGEVKLWDAETGKELLAINAPTHDAWCMAVSPDGKRLASGGAKAGSEKLRYAGEVKVWDAQTGREILTCNGLVGLVNSVAFSPDGKRLAGASRDKTVKVWDAETGQELFTFKGHAYGVNSAVFSPDGTRLASGSSDGTVKVWDATTSPEARTFRGVSGNVTSIAFSPDGKRLATGSGTWRIRNRATTVPVDVKVWDAETGNELLSLQGHTNLVTSVAFTPDGKHLASASDDKTVKVWDAQTGQKLFTLQGHTDRVMSVAFSPDGKRVASAGGPGGEGAKGEVKLWDAQTGMELHSLAGHTNRVTSVAFSPDGKRLASNSRGETVKVWDVQTGQELLSFQGRNASVSNVAFSPDGKRLAGTSQDEPVVKVWDAQTGQELLSLKGHTAQPYSVAFSPDGKRLASGSDDMPENQGEIKVWNAETGQELLTFKGGATPPGSNIFHRVVFSPNGHWLASNTGGTVKIYDATPLPEKP